MLLRNFHSFGIFLRLDFLKINIIYDEHQCSGARKEN